MEFIDEKLSAYAEAHTRPEGALLAALNRETFANVLMPRMLSGHLQGQFLRMLSFMIGPRRILEIGTYTGYSAICLAAGLRPDGQLHTIDVNEELEDMVKRYIQQAGLADKIVQHIGDAAAIIPQLKGRFDVVFIDADKENYSKYYDLVFPMVPSGGFIIADNVLWSGKVLDDKKDKDTAAIHAFNEKTAQDERVETVLLPVRDGLMLIRKK